MKEPVWMREGDCLALHNQQILLFGGLPGVRDYDLLQSALARPKNKFLYAERKSTFSELAAAYAFAISSNHPFVDGNKRTAMITSFVFLEYNGVSITASQEEACLTFIALAAGKITESKLAIWFKQHSVARKRPGHRK